jgi:hypothetical protein
MIKSKKDFDAVLMMRTIREELSRKINGMTLDEEITWLMTSEIKDPFLKRLQEKVSQPADRPDNIK